MANHDDMDCDRIASEHPVFDYVPSFKKVQTMRRFERRSRIVLGATDAVGMHVRFSLENMHRFARLHVRSDFNYWRPQMELDYFIAELCETFDHELVHVELGHGRFSPDREKDKELEEIEEFWCNEFSFAGNWARSEESD